MIPAAVLAIGTAWAGGMEVIRLGNEHIGPRARFENLRANFRIMFGVGMAMDYAASRLRSEEGAHATMSCRFAKCSNGVLSSDRTPWTSSIVFAAMVACARCKGQGG